jgi:hypothetical protein
MEIKYDEEYCFEDKREVRRMRRILRKRRERMRKIILKRRERMRMIG